MKYFDKTGKEIKAGHIIRSDDGDIQLVYKCVNMYYDDDLGVNASNIAYLRNHPDAERQFYPLHQFDTKNEWTIVGDKEHDLDLLDEDHKNLALGKI